MAKKNVLTHARKLKADKLALENRLDEALALYESVCRTDRLDAEAWVKSSVTQRRLGRHAEAEASARQALAVQPNLSFAVYALAAALHSQGRLDEALTAYRRAIELNPAFPDAHYLFACALHDNGQMQEAVAAYRQAIALRPDYFEALSDLGVALMALGETGEAALHLNRALALRPHSVDARCNLGSLLHVGGQVEQARGMFEHALRIDPGSVKAMASLAALLERLGETDEAQTLVTRGLAAEPDEALLNLVAARLERREKRLQEAAVRLEKLRARALSPDLAGEIHLLLGQLRDELGDADGAYASLVEGNRLLARISLRGVAEKDRYLQFVEAFGRKMVEELARGVPTPTESGGGEPAFLIGFPRSGTTLLEQILDSHPRIQTLEEKPAVAAMLDAYQAWSNERRQGLAELGPADIVCLRDVYFSEVAKHLDRDPDALLVDKLPLNTVLVPLIWRVFPRANFILALRHPCDVCLSCFMQSFAANAGMASFYTLEDAARTYTKVMGLWRTYEQLLPLRSHRVRYEDVVADVARAAHDVLDFLGVEWNDAVLAHTEHARRRGAIRTPSYHQVTQPIYRHAQYRWERYAKAFEPLLSELRPFIEHFGYGEPGTSSV